jgi:hypothetical protein
MGTRNLTMVINKGETKVAQYGQWDGYPSGQGAEILKFLRFLGTDKNSKSKILKEYKENDWVRDNVKEFLKLKNLSIETFKENLESLFFFTKEEIDLIDEDFDKSLKQRPYLSRNTASGILWEIAEGNVDKLISQENFAGDSLFCEWAYVVDLDKNTFEVYKGNNKEKLEEKDRFFYLQEEDSEYKPVTLLKSYDLNNLPTLEEFLELEKEEEEE